MARRLLNRERMKGLVCLLALAGCFTDSHKCPAVVNVAKEPAQSLRDPATGQCDPISYPQPYPCDPQCGPCAESGGAAVGAEPDWGSCFGPCESLDEQTCLGSTTCHTAYLQGPGPGAIQFWGCWDLPPSGAVTGTCTGDDAQTCTEHPDCTSLYASGSPDSYVSCSPKTAPPACSTLTTEAACTARPDCDAIYIGMNCTCTPSGCTCATETYDHCQAR